MKFILELDLDGQFDLTDNFKIMLVHAAKAVADNIPNERLMQEGFDGQTADSKKEFAVLLEIRDPEKDEVMIRGVMTKNAFNKEKFSNNLNVTTKVKEVTILQHEYRAK